MTKSRALVMGAALAGSTLLTPASGAAALMNFGVDYLSNGTAHQVSGGIIGDDTGVTIRHRHLTTSVFTPALTPAAAASSQAPASAGTRIQSLQLFVDATGVGPGDRVQVSAFDADSATYVVIGNLANTTHANTSVPTLGAAGPGRHTPIANDVDNSFFTLDPLIFGNEVLNGGLSLRFAMLGTGLFRSARIDAANLQVGTVEMQETVAVAPEPGSLLLLGTGLAAFGWRRRRLS